MLDQVLKRECGAFDQLLASVGIQPGGVIVTERMGLQLVAIMAGKDQMEALRTATRDLFGLELPEGPKRSARPNLELFGVGPRTWIALRENDGSNLHSELGRAFGSLVAVTDLSDGYGVLCLRGPKVCATLEKGITVDLNREVFTIADVVVTDCAHMGVVLWKTDEYPTINIALFRSLAGSFWHWLSLSAAEFGLSVGT